MDAQILEIETPHGTARAQLHPAPSARAALVLGHGAGGNLDAPDLLAARDVAVAAGMSVALVEQPWRVAGRRAPAPIAHCDTAFIEVVTQLQRRTIRDLPLIVGGRSMGARVACRTAETLGAVAVLCLAFPLQPPARKGKEPAPDRLPELDAVAVPTLVVQGERDRFGMPPPRHSPSRPREVATVAGDHGMKADVPAIAAAIEAWLSTRAR